MIYSHYLQFLAELHGILMHGFEKKMAKNLIFWAKMVNFGPKKDPKQAKKISLSINKPKILFK